MLLPLSGSGRPYRTEGLGNGNPPAGSRGRALGGWFGWGIASRKLIAVIKDIWLPNHAQLCVFSSTTQPGIFLCTQFRGRPPGPFPGCAAGLSAENKLTDGPKNCNERSHRKIAPSPIGSGRPYRNQWRSCVVGRVGIVQGAPECRGPRVPCCSGVARNFRRGVRQSVAFLSVHSH